MLIVTSKSYWLFWHVEVLAALEKLACFRRCYLFSLACAIAWLGIAVTHVKQMLGVLGK